MIWILLPVLLTKNKNKKNIGVSFLCTGRRGCLCGFFSERGLYKYMFWKKSAHFLGMVSLYDIKINMRGVCGIYLSYCPRVTPFVRDRRGHALTGNVLPGASVFLIYVLSGIGFLILA